MVETFYSTTDKIPFTADLVDKFVRSTMHIQQHVEILEIVSPDLAESVYLSTALVIAALQRLGSEAQFPSDRALQQNKCIQLSKSVRDFYMPSPWNGKEP